MIPIASPYLDESELNIVIEVLKSSWISSRGEYIQRFEKEFASYCGMKYGVSTSNGTTALHLALAALGINKGDEVVVPTLTFISTANAARYCNAEPVLVDSNPDYWCIEPEKIEEKITKKTKAIIPVHLYGHACDMKHIIDIAEDHGLYVIEDCAEAHGAEYNGKKVGSFGHINCFSFYGNKIITTGEGGMCLTSDENLKEKMITLKDHGKVKTKEYLHETLGFNYRMTNIQAAIGLIQLKKIDKILKKRDLIKKTYNNKLKVFDNIILPPSMKWANPVCWLYTIIIKGKNKEKIINELERNGIDSRPLLYPIHKQPIYNIKGNYPVAEYLAEYGISLPSSPNLKKEELVYIINVLTNAISR